MNSVYYKITVLYQPKSYILLSTIWCILSTRACLSSKYFETVSSLLRTTLRMYRKVRCHVFAIISIKWKLVKFSNSILIGQEDGPMGSFGIWKLALEQSDMRRYYNTRTATKQAKTVDWTGRIYPDTCYRMRKEFRQTISVNYDTWLKIKFKAS